MDRIYVMQLVRSLQVGEIDRRTFLSRATAAIGSFSAASLLLAACQSVGEAPRPVTEPVPTGEGVGSPQTSMTTEEGLIAGRVEYPGPDGETLSGYWARPQGEGSWPAVIVVQEWWGVNEHIMDVTRRIAAQGYVALAPDLYKGQIATEPDEARKLVMELDMPAAVEEIGSAIDFLLAQEFVRGDKAGIVGFCMGGRLTLMTALVNDKLAVAVPFYGAPLTPEEAVQVKAPVLGLYGAEDSGIPVNAVLAMEKALAEAGIDHEIHIYEGAPHAFFNDTRASYRPEAAADAWERTLRWFEKYLNRQ